MTCRRVIRASFSVARESATSSVCSEARVRSAAQRILRKSGPVRGRGDTWPTVRTGHDARRSTFSVTDPSSRRSKPAAAVGADDQEVGGQGIRLLQDDSPGIALDHLGLDGRTLAQEGRHHIFEAMCRLLMLCPRSPRRGERGSGTDPRPPASTKGSEGNDVKSLDPRVEPVPSRTARSRAGPENSEKSTGQRMRSISMRVCAMGHLRSCSRANEVPSWASGIQGLFRPARAAYRKRLRVLPPEGRKACAPRLDSGIQQAPQGWHATW